VLARSPRPERAGAGQRDQQGAHPLEHPGAGLPVIPGWRAAARASTHGRPIAGRFSLPAPLPWLRPLRSLPSLPSLPSLSSLPSLRSLLSRLALLAVVALPVALLAALVGTTMPPAHAATSVPVTAVAVGVDDGDSFVARRRDGAKIRVRIAGIDAPEKSQPWAAVARKRLRELLVGREIRI